MFTVDQLVAHAVGDYILAGATTWNYQQYAPIVLVR